jgi:alkanesulfonate monooxygenase SsuD/methylene tetrahydromethanopterin reductase-like flavin-dependent oxidoreductase (luciferase family)
MIWREGIRRTMTDQRRPSFGIKTTPVHTTYGDIFRVWKEADTVPEIEHAWLWDHMLPQFGDVAGPIFEGWTLLAALAAQTERLRLGLLVTSNLTCPPAVLAKMAATTDVIANGRLVLGIGVGGTDKPDRPGQELAVREYDNYGLPLVPPNEGVERLAEACTIFRRMWTEDLFDFEGRYYTAITP